jgi:hypothetical protein
MSSHDDPEARIRELERSLSDRASELTQSSSESGAGHGGQYVDAPPAPQPPYMAPPSSHGLPFPPVPVASSGGTGRGWLVFAVLGAVMVAIVAGVVIFVSNVFSSVSSVIDTFGGSPTASGGADRPPAPTAAPTVELAPPGGDVSVAGVGGNKTIACRDTDVNVSGVSNTIVLTGHCRTVTVSGVQNTVTIDAAETISASGFENRVTFLTGTPEIQNSGASNVVEPG